MTQRAIKFDLDQDGIALLSIDVENQNMNVINQTSWKNLRHT